MRHKVKKVLIGSDKDHRTSLMRTMAMQVIIYEKIKTTRAKAKAIQPFVENLITIAKKEDKVHAIREIERLLQHKNCSKKIFEELVERYKDKNSGYTKTVNLGPRAGDNAPMVQLQLI
jgi:large subunit ribosomal protein L17